MRKAYATMSKVIAGNGVLYSCLIEPQGVSVWWKETTKTHIFLFSRSLSLNHLETHSYKANLLLPILPIGIVAHSLTLFWDNLYRNRCIFQGKNLGTCVWKKFQSIRRHVNLCTQWGCAEVISANILNRPFSTGRFVAPWQTMWWHSRELLVGRSSHQQSWTKVVETLPEKDLFR